MEQTVFKKRRSWMWVIIVVGAFLLLYLSSSVIQPGYKGVIFSYNGGLQKRILNQGLNFHLPWPIDQVTQYPVTTETVYLTRNPLEGNPTDESMDVNTGDGKSLNVDIVYSFHMDPDKLLTVFNTFRDRDTSQIEAGYIKTQIKTITQSVTTQYSVLQVYAEKRSEVTQKIQEQLAVALKKDGIILENFALSDVRPDAATLKSLQAIADAQNQQELLKREQKNKEQQMINDKIDAENKKQVTLIQASADAQSTLIEATAKAEANKKLELTLTPELIQYEWIKKWDGKLPTVQTGGGSLIQIPMGAVQ